MASYIMVNIGSAISLSPDQYLLPEPALTYRKTSNISRTLVDIKLLITQM